MLVELIKTLTKPGNKIRHGEIQMVFAPKEDCGEAAKRIDTARFNPDIYYDIDGGEVGSVLSSNFSAERLNLRFIGKPAHPSEAKQLDYDDALACASRFVASFPLDVNPANSEGRQGYIHFYQMDRNGDDYSLYTRIRYFSREEGSLFSRMIDRALAQAETDFPSVKIEVLARGLQYENVEPTLHPKAIDIVATATRKAGITPEIAPVRAGTTAAMMAARGLKGGCCIGSARNNDHTIYEYVSIDDMCKVHEIGLNIVGEVSSLK